MSQAILEQLARAFGENSRAAALPVGQQIPEGRRNETLTSLAGSMRRRGLEEHEITVALRELNKRCVPPLAEREVESIAHSVARYPAAEFVSDHIGERVWSERKLTFHTAAQIARETPAQVEWVARPWIARGSVTELVGKVKAAGKTTWMTHLIRAVLDGAEFMGEPTAKTPVVFLTEQRPGTVREALRRADLLSRDDLHILYWHDTIGLAWPDVVHIAGDYCLKVGAKLLVVDTVSQFAGLRGDSENDAGAALETVQPLQELAALNIGICAVRQERKGGGEVGESGRGSSAFAGAADIVLALRRGEGNTRPTVRVIHALSRYDETPDSLVIDRLHGARLADGRRCTGSEGGDPGSSAGERGCSAKGEGVDGGTARGGISFVGGAPCHRGANQRRRSSTLWQGQKRRSLPLLQSGNCL